MPRTRINCPNCRQPILADVEQLAKADGQREAFAARGVLEAVFELVSVQRKQRAWVQAQPAGSHRKGLGVVLGKVGKINPHPRVGKRDLRAVGADDLAARSQTARREGWAGIGMRLAIVGDDIQERPRDPLDRRNTPRRFTGRCYGPVFQAAAEKPTSQQRSAGDSYDAHYRAARAHS